MRFKDAYFFTLMSRSGAIFLHLPTSKSKYKSFVSTVVQHKEPAPWKAYTTLPPRQQKIFSIKAACEDANKVKMETSCGGRTLTSPSSMKSQGHYQISRTKTTSFHWSSSLALGGRILIIYPGRKWRIFTSSLVLFYELQALSTSLPST